MVLANPVRSPVRRAAALLLLLGVPLALLVACGEPERVNLSTLVGREDEYDGQQIEVHGRVTAFEDEQWGRYYVVEDARNNRVRLNPAEQAEPFEGREVRVTGRFSFQDDEGRRLDIDEIGPPSAE